MIDPLAVHDVGPFWDVVCDPSQDVVMHAAGEDLRICLLKTGTLPRACSTCRWPPDWLGSAIRCRS